MALTRFSGDANVISQLDNQPNDNDGLSAAQLKAKFDQFGSVYKEYLNSILIPELESAIDAAAAGVGQQGFSGAILLDNSVASEKLLSSSGIEAVSTAVIRALAVTTAKIAANAVTWDKLATAVQDIIDAKLNASDYVIDSAMSASSENPVQNKVVNTALAGKQNTLTFDNAPTANSNNPVKSSGIKSALDAKQNTLSYDSTPTAGHTTQVISSASLKTLLDAKLNTSSVDSSLSSTSTNPVQNKVINAALAGKQNTLTIDTALSTSSTNPVRNSAIATAINGKQKQHSKVTSSSIATTAWNSSNQTTVTISGVTSSNTIIVTPAPASYLTWCDCGVRCTAQGSNQITLTARTKPGSAITVQVIILD